MLKDNWVDKQDGIDDILAEDINSIANAVIETQEEINKIVIDQTYSPDSENAQSGKAVAEAVSDKQDSLVSGTNIKTINNQSILGSGNITIEGGSDVEVDQTYNPTSENAQSGKAVAEAVNAIYHPKRTIKLANDFTVTEENTVNLNFSVDDDGTPYDFDFIEVIFVPVTSGVSNVFVDIRIFSGIDYTSPIADGAIQTTTAGADNIFLFYADKNLSWSGYAVRRGGGVGQPYAYGYVMPIIAANQDYEVVNTSKNAKGIYVKSNVEFPVGAKIKIFGGKYQ